MKPSAEPQLSQPRTRWGHPSGPEDPDNVEEDTPAWCKLGVLMGAEYGGGARRGLGRGVASGEKSEQLGEQADEQLGEQT